MPEVKYLFVSPGGTIVEASEKDLCDPLILSLKGTHGTLTLLDYFRALETFLLKENPDRFLSALRMTLDNPSIRMSSIAEIDLYSVKVGAFYHIAEVDVLCHNSCAKFAVSSAFTPIGRQCLRHDFHTVTKLRRQTGQSYLPRPFFIGTPGGNTQGHNFLMVLWEWLEDFHEWHFSKDRETDRNRIVLWDTTHGVHFLQRAEEKEIFRQIAKILTLCFDPESADQVCRWHNAAGDFIVSHDGDELETRLTTVREYHPILEYEGDSLEDINLHLLYFFLDLTVRISMDRLDGTDKPVWADEVFLVPVVQGFMEGLTCLQEQKRIRAEETENFIKLLKSMSHEDLSNVFQPLREKYQDENSLDSSLIAANLEEHIKNLYKTLQSV